ncbi:MAG: hypothetical protein ABFD07_10955 [Methanobacterium sp.]
MQTYKFKDKEYRVICAVHRAVKDIIETLDIDKEIKNDIISLVDIANDMAINMEHALERKRDFGIGLFSFPEEEDE